MSTKTGTVNPNLTLASQSITGFKNAYYNHVFLTQLEQPIEVAQEALKVAKENNKITILNPAPAARLPKEIFGLCDFITPNE